MVERERSREADVAIRLHGAVHVHVSIVHESLLKARKLSPHVAEVDHDDLVDGPHLADGIVDIDAFHLRHAALAEQHAVR